MNEDGFEAEDDINTRCCMIKKFQVLNRVDICQVTTDRSFGDATGASLFIHCCSLLRIPDGDGDRDLAE
jgi:hypothetical protein